MSSALIIGLVVLAAAGWIAFAARSPLDRAIREALRSKDVAPLLDTIGERSEEEQPTAYDYAIGKLWYAYERALAAKLVDRFARDYHATRIAQYWLQQLLTTEPGIAKQTFDADFLETYYQPEVAAKCGKSS